MEDPIIAEDKVAQKQAEDGTETKAAEGASPNTLAVANLIAIVVFAIVAIAVFVYLLEVVTGKIDKSARLDTPEIGLAVITCLGIILAIHPSALDRLNLLKLPGGIELTLKKIKHCQTQQGESIDISFRILSNQLSIYEKHHLRTLGRATGPENPYFGGEPLRQELWRLQRYGLIGEEKGQKIGAMLDGQPFDLRSFVHLTLQGKKFIKALSKIEA